MIYLVTARGGTWFLEQPSQSVLEYYPAFRKMLLDHFNVRGRDAAARFLLFTLQVGLCAVCEREVGREAEAEAARERERETERGREIQRSAVDKVLDTKWWMCQYGAPTPKRHYAYSNSDKIHLLNQGKLYVKCAQRSETVSRKRNAEGKECYTETRELRATECPGCCS